MAKSSAPEHSHTKLICKTEITVHITLSNFCFILELINSVVFQCTTNDSFIYMYMCLFSNSFPI